MTKAIAAPAEGQGLYAWATQALSAQRARAFHNALRALEDSRFSADWREANKAEDAVVREARLARASEISAIEATARQKVAALEDQIRVLREQADAVREAGYELVAVINSEVYNTPECKAAREVCSAIWHRDNDAIEPQRQALVAKYIAAEGKAN